MALLYYTPYTDRWNGRIGGDLYRICPTQKVVQSGVLRASPRMKRWWQEQRHRQPAADRWLTLTSEQQTSWNDFAADTLLYDRAGANVITSGNDYYVTWNTNNRYYNSVENWQDTAPMAPTWTASKPKFSEWADIVEGALTLTAETNIPAGCRVGCYGGPPTNKPFRLDRSKELYLGSVTFNDGLGAGQSTAAFSALYEAVWGASVVDTFQGQWLRLVEIERGYVRSLKDPCKGPSVLFEATLRNVDATNTIQTTSWKVFSPEGVPEETQFANNIGPGGQVTKQWTIPFKWLKKKWIFNLFWQWDQTFSGQIDERPPQIPFLLEIARPE